MKAPSGGRTDHDDILRNAARRGPLPPRQCDHPGRASSRRYRHRCRRGPVAGRYPRRGRGHRRHRRAGQPRRRRSAGARSRQGAGLALLRRHAHASRQGPYHPAPRQSRRDLPRGARRRRGRPRGALDDGRCARADGVRASLRLCAWHQADPHAYRFRAAAVPGLLAGLRRGARGLGRADRPAGRRADADRSLFRRRLCEAPGRDAS